MKKILIADDHPMMLNGIKTYVESLGYDVIHTCENGEEVLVKIALKKPDIIILDLNMPILNGIEVLQKIRIQDPDIKVVIYTMHNEKNYLDAAISLGANGYLLKDFALEEISICLQKISVGEKWFSQKLDDAIVAMKHDLETQKIMLLTSAEKKILSLIGQDYNTKDIADLLFISEKTVEKHRSNIVKKLGLPSEKNILQRFALKINYKFY
ncbi:response regulator [Flavobacterium sp.]|jgi:two-component system nitrate/nitrite response regulator NarL|uniref:response regulator n=1 Tax=Flavobacterium sp. TaxID=239 RepID=UPI0037C09045